MRILNADRLTSHGNVAGRRAMVEILEAGLEAGNPYNNTLKFLRVEGNTLLVGGDPHSSPTAARRSARTRTTSERVGRIFVFGAAKGVQYSAKAIEDVLGDRLTGGCVIAKHGDETDPRARRGRLRRASRARRGLRRRLPADPRAVRGPPARRPRLHGDRERRVLAADAPRAAADDRGPARRHPDHADRARRADGRA